MKKLFVFMAVSFATGTMLADFVLMQDRKPKCSIVITKNADVAQKYAASELATYLGKIGGGTAPNISKSKQADLYPIIFHLTDDSELEPEGFKLDSNKKRLLISAKAPVGLLYGAYEVLKRYGGIRWLYPGADGEYYKIKDIISIPQINKVFNPDFEFRTGNNIGNTKNCRKWVLRNNMRLIGPHNRMKRFREFAPLIMEGYQCFTRLLAGIGVDTNDYSQLRPRLEKLYKTHPEYFPLHKGKRIFLLNKRGRTDRQICTTNKDVREIMARNLSRQIKEKVPTAKDGRFWLAPADGTLWCECPACKAVDSKNDIKNGYITSRYWEFMNFLAKKAYADNPNARIMGIAYQNFQIPPEFPIDKRLDVMLAFNRRCWRHKIDDSSCPANRIYNKFYHAWKAKGTKFCVWEQLTYAGETFSPIEKNIYHTLQYYKKLDALGAFPETLPELWRAMWQTMYISATFQWDLNQDFDKVYEEINSLFYGKGWEGGMKQFRKLFTETYNTTPGCHGYGHSSPMGLLLANPQVHKKLNQYLDAAEKAAEADSDPRALRHVKEDRKLFESTWVKARTEYVKNFRELNIYERTGSIKIDGVFNEKDWQTAEPLTSFKTKDGKSAKRQTLVKVIYDRNNLYFAVEALEKEPSKMLTTVKKADGPVWTDNSFEIYLNHPGMDKKYAQIIINAKDVVFDHLVNGAKSDRCYNSGIKVKSRILKDRWLIEAKVPVAQLKSICKNGATWHMNFLRVVQLNDGTKEISTPGIGKTTHSADTFLPVILAGKRTVNHASGTEVNAKAWFNPSFDKVIKLRRPRNDWDIKDSRVPAYWALSGTKFPGKPSLEVIQDSANSGNYFLKLGHYAMIFQKFRGRANKLKITFKAKGKGALRIFAIRKIKKDGEKGYKGLQNQSIKTIKLNTEKWQNYSFNYTKKDERVVVYIAFFVENGTVFLDDANTLLVE